MEYCEWSEQTGQHSTTYSAEHIVISVRVLLWHDPSQLFPAGSSTYAFSFPAIPLNAPASIILPHGYVRYKLKVNLDIPWGIDGSQEKMLKIVAHTGHLTKVSARQPRHSEHSSSIGCVEGDLHLGLSLTDESPPIVTPGTPLTALANIENHSSRSLNFSRFQLVRTIEYHTTANVKRERTVLFKKIIPSGALGPRSSFSDRVITNPITANMGKSILGRVVVVHFALELVAGPKMALDRSVGIFVILDHDLESSRQKSRISNSSRIHPPPSADTVQPPSYPSIGVVPVPNATALPVASHHVHVAVGDAAFAQMITGMETSGSVDKMKFAKEFANAQSDGSMTPSPEQLADAISKVFSLEQEDFVQLIAPKLAGITCSHVVAVLNIAATTGKTKILKILAPKIVDWNNREVIIQRASILDQEEYSRILSSK